VQEQIDVVFEENVPVLASGLGDPAPVVPTAHEAGMKVLALVGNTRNATRVAAGGVDIVVAQGYDGGGHTGRVGTLSLVPQVIDAVDVPVAAAGGIADGRGIAAALALEPAIPRSSAGALTDLVKNSGVGGPNLGLVEFDSPDLDYSFFYPKGWKVLRNRLRRGVIVSDFDAPVGNPKVYVEVVSAPPAGELAGDSPAGDAPSGDSPGVDESRKLAIRRRAVDALVAPVENDNSGDGKLEAPPMRLVKDLDFSGVPGSNGVSNSRGFESYDYFTFASETTTRSGYDVTRRHYAVAKTKGGLVYVLSASATTDGFDETRARLFERIVASFVVN